MIGMYSSLIMWLGPESYEIFIMHIFFIHIYVDVKYSIYQHYMYLDGVFFEVSSALNKDNIIAAGLRIIWGCIL